MEVTNNEKYHLAIDKMIEPDVSRDNVRVTFEYTGEGLWGDYTGEEDDMPVMRFYTWKRKTDDTYPDYEVDKNGNEWEEVEDGSYCTRVPVDTPNETLEKLAWILLERLEEYVDAGDSIKKLVEELSLIDETWIKK